MSCLRGVKRSRETFKAEVWKWAAKVGVSPKQVRIQRMTRKWASCSRRGRLSFNMDLLSEARSFRRYVIVHEVLHLKVPNHGRLFKALLDAYAPELASQMTLHQTFGFTRRARASGTRYGAGP